MAGCEEGRKGKHTLSGLPVLKINRTKSALHCCSSIRNSSGYNNTITENSKQDYAKY